jgi:hypothetical protein
VADFPLILSDLHNRLKKKGPLTIRIVTESPIWDLFAVTVGSLEIAGNTVKGSTEYCIPSALLADLAKELWTVAQEYPPESQIYREILQVYEVIHETQS